MGYSPQQGYKCVYSSDAIVYHRGKVSGTTRTAAEDDTRALFMKKWAKNYLDDGYKVRIIISPPLPFFTNFFTYFFVLFRTFILRKTKRASCYAYSLCYFSCRTQLSSLASNLFSLQTYIFQHRPPSPCI